MNKKRGVKNSIRKKTRKIKSKIKKKVVKRKVKVSKRKVVKTKKPSLTKQQESFLDKIISKPPPKKQIVKLATKTATKGVSKPTIKIRSLFYGTPKSLALRTL